MAADSIERTLGRILATQEHIIKQLEKHDGKLDSHIDDDQRIEERVDKLEQSRSYLFGAVAAISLVLPYLSDIFLTKMGLK